MSNHATKYILSVESIGLNKFQSIKVKQVGVSSACIATRECTSLNSSVNRHKGTKTHLCGKLATKAKARTQGPGSAFSVGRVNGIRTRDLQPEAGVQPRTSPTELSLDMARPKGIRTPTFYTAPPKQR